MMRPTSVLVVALAAAPAAQNCGNTSIGVTPLNDLGPGSYQGFQGGLYPGGQNVPPPAHAQAGLQLAQTLAPLDAQGNPDPNGKIVLVSIGMSNTTQEFSTWLAISNSDPNRAAPVVVVDGAQGGQDARRISDPGAAFWTNVDQRLQNAAVTPQQVRVAWVKQAVAGPRDPFPTHAQDLSNLLESIVQILKTRYPNLELCYLSSRIYAGYATTALNPEPFAYESAFSVKWLIERQAAGDAALNYDPANGAVRAPWLAWGPYLWADGLIPRGDGAIWECGDFAADGTHPGPSGRSKVAAMLDAHFTGDPTTVPWYVGQGGGQPRAAVNWFGDGCPATQPRLRANGLPSLGNTEFRYGITSGPASQPTTLFFSLGQADLRIAGSCRLLVDPARLIGTLSTQTSATGNANFRIPIPNVSALAGVELQTQWVVLDPAGVPYPTLPGLAMTRGGELVLGR